LLFQCFQVHRLRAQFSLADAHGTEKPYLIHAAYLEQTMGVCLVPGCRLEVIGDRELAFFGGKACGSLYQGFTYDSENGAHAAPIRFRAVHAGSAAAGEVEGDALDEAVRAAGWEECRDYINGGPSFVWMDGSQVDAAHTLGTTGDHEAGAGTEDHAASMVIPKPPPQQQQQQRRQRQQVADVQVLATYPEEGHAAAALLCRVGSGRVVLCGTHPELQTFWLENWEAEVPGRAWVGDASAPDGSEAGGSGQVWGHVGTHPQQQQPHNDPIQLARLKAELDENEGARWRYWLSLLNALGLSRYLSADSHNELNPR
jgi:hypothetical protein